MTYAIIPYSQPVTLPTPKSTPTNKNSTAPSQIYKSYFSSQKQTCYQDGGGRGGILYAITSFFTSPPPTKSSPDSSILDTSSIPLPVHSLLRFHLLSTTLYPTSFIPIRSITSSPCCDLFIADTGILCSISSKETALLYTSDYDNLHRRKGISEEILHESYARATVISHDCCAISWGFNHGIVVIYRKLLLHKGTKWVAVAILLSSVNPSPCAKATELLSVTFGGGSGSNKTPRLSFLIVGRLGGRIEIVLLPSVLLDESASRIPVSKLLAPWRIDASPHCDEIVSMDVLTTSTDDVKCHEFLLACGGFSSASKDNVVVFWKVRASPGGNRESRPCDVTVKFLCKVCVSGIPPVMTYLSPPSLETISTTAPLLQIRFSPLSSSLSSSSPALILSILDYHGGISLLNCENLSKNGSLSWLSSRVSGGGTPSDPVVRIAWWVTKVSTETRPLSPLPSFYLISVQKSSKLNVCDVIGKSEPLVLTSCQMGGVAIATCEVRYPSSQLYFVRVEHSNVITPAAMECLEPIKMVHMLLDNKKMSEALIMAQRYNLEVEELYRCLWDQHVKEKTVTVGDVTQYFTKFENDRLVISTALSTNSLGDKCDYHTIKAVLQEGIRRERLLTKDQSSTSERLLQLQSTHRQLMMFYALCQMHDTRFSSPKFHNCFMTVPPLAFAQNAARRGDVETLALLFLRHGELLLQRLSLLEMIPLSLPPERYACVLPVVGGGFLLQGSQVMDVAALVATILAEKNIKKVWEEDEEEKNDPPPSPSYSLETLSTWYHTRALRITSSLNQLPHTLSLLSLAQERNAIDEKCHNLYVDVYHLHHLIVGGSLPITTSLSTFQNMDGNVLARTIFPQDENRNIVEWYTRHVPPLTSGPLALKEKSVELREALEQQLIHRCASHCSLQLTVAVAQQSRSTLVLSQRVLPSSSNLISLVLQVIYATQNWNNDEKVADQLDVMWDLYETLPVRTNRDDDTLVSLHNDVDKLKRYLIGIDVASGYYRPPTPLVLRDAEDNGTLQTMGVDIVEQLLHGFCHMLTNKKTSLPDDYAALLGELLYDLGELLRHGVFPSLPLSNLIGTCFIPELVRQELFDILIKVAHVPTSDKNVWDANVVKDAIIKSVTDALFLHDFNWRKCREVLRGLYPELNTLFEREKRLLHAYDIIAELGASIELKLVRDRDPLYILQQVIHSSPSSIVAKSEWNDERYAQSFHAACRQQECDPMMSAPLENPFPPGEELRRLAGVLGLHSSSKKLLEMEVAAAQQALEVGLYGAASYVALSLLENAKYQEKVSKLRLLSRVVVGLVTAEEYGDLETKLYLCRRGLSVFSFDCEGYDSLLSAFSQLEMMKRKDQLMSLSQQTQMIRPDETKEEEIPLSRPTRPTQGSSTNESFLVFKAAGFLTKTAKSMTQSLVDPYASDTTPWMTAVDSDATLTKNHMTDKDIEVEDLLSSLRTNMLRFQPSHDNMDVINMNASLLSYLSNTILEYYLEISTTLHPNPMMSSHPLPFLPMALVILLDPSATPSPLPQTILDTLSRNIHHSNTTSAQGNNTPDIEIVRRLTSQGYSLHGARRSATAVSNASFAAAWQWALQHVGDTNFDLPLVSVKDSHPDGDCTRMDVEAGWRLKAGLGLVLNVLEKRHSLWGVKAKEPEDKVVKKREEKEETVASSDGWDFESQDEDNDLLNENEEYDEAPVINGPTKIQIAVKVAAASQKIPSDGWDIDSNDENDNGIEKDNVELSVTESHISKQAVATPLFIPSEIIESRNKSLKQDSNMTASKTATRAVMVPAVTCEKVISDGWDFDTNGENDDIIDDDEGFEEGLSNAKLNVAKSQTTTQALVTSVFTSSKMTESKDKSSKQEINTAESQLTPRDMLMPLPSAFEEGDGNNDDINEDADGWSFTDEDASLSDGKEIKDELNVLPSTPTMTGTSVTTENMKETDKKNQQPLVKSQAKTKAVPSPPPPPPPIIKTKGSKPSPEAIISTPAGVMAHSSGNTKGVLSPPSKVETVQSQSFYEAKMIPPPPPPPPPPATKKAQLLPPAKKTSILLPSAAAGRSIPPPEPVPLTSNPPIQMKAEISPPPPPPPPSLSEVESMPASPAIPISIRPPSPIKIPPRSETNISTTRTHKPLSSHSPPPKRIMVPPPRRPSPSQFSTAEKKKWATEGRKIFLAAKNVKSPSSSDARERQRLAQLGRKLLLEARTHNTTSSDDLQQNGRAAALAMTVPPPPPNAAKLALEGRRLLEEARKNRTVSHPTSKSLTVSSSLTVPPPPQGMSTTTTTHGSPKSEKNGDKEEAMSSFRDDLNFDDDLLPSEHNSTSLVANAMTEGSTNEQNGTSDGWDFDDF